MVPALPPARGSSPYWPASSIPAGNAATRPGPTWQRLSPIGAPAAPSRLCHSRGSERLPAIVAFDASPWNAAMTSLDLELFDPAPELETPPSAAVRPTFRAVAR